MQVRYTLRAFQPVESLGFDIPYEDQCPPRVYQGFTAPLESTLSFLHFVMQQRALPTETLELSVHAWMQSAPPLCAASIFLFDSGIETTREITIPDPPVPCDEGEVRVEPASIVVARERLFPDVTHPWRRRDAPATRQFSRENLRIRHHRHEASDVVISRQTRSTRQRARNAIVDTDSPSISNGRQYASAQDRLSVHRTDAPIIPSITSASQHLSVSALGAPENKPCEPKRQSESGARYSP